MHRQRACALSRFIIKARFLIEMKLYQEYLNYLSDLIFPGICPVCEKAPYQDGLSYMCLAVSYTHLTLPTTPYV